MTLQHGDILHFKAKGFERLKAGLNRMRTGIYLEIENESMVAIYVDGTVALITLYNFSKCYDYISSRPNWVTSPTKEVFSRIGRKFKNEHVMFAEIIGAPDFDKAKHGSILEICIDKEWLSE